MKYLLSLLLLFTTGCAANYNKFYTNMSPIKYEKTKDISIYYSENGNASLEYFYNNHFNDLLKLGSLSFSSTEECFCDFRSHARKNGADVVILKENYKGTVQYTNHINMPKSASSYNYNSGMTTYNYSESVPYTSSVDRFSYKALFLKNINNVKLPWEYTKSDFSFEEKNNDKFTGTWITDGYEVDIFKNKVEYLGFIRTTSSDDYIFFKPESKPVPINKHLSWTPDDLKFRFNKESMSGTYISGTKMPTNIKASINKFGFLELNAGDTSFNFIRKK